MRVVVVDWCGYSCARHHLPTSLSSPAEDMKNLLPKELHDKLITREWHPHCGVAVGTCSCLALVALFPPLCTCATQHPCTHAANIAAKLKGELKSFEKAIDAMLQVPTNIVLPPSKSDAPSRNELLVMRVLLVDKLLRDLLMGPQDEVAIDRWFAGRKAVLERLLSFVSGNLRAFGYVKRTAVDSRRGVWCSRRVHVPSMSCDLCDCPCVHSDACNSRGLQSSPRHYQCRCTSHAPCAARPVLGRLPQGGHHQLRVRRCAPHRGCNACECAPQSAHSAGALAARVVGCGL